MPELPSPDSVHKRPICEVLEQECAQPNQDHEECLYMIGARWPEPLPYTDLEEELW